MLCQPVTFLTPKRFLLNGLWFFSGKQKRAVIFIHGLGGSMFWPEVVDQLFSTSTAVLTFNNRGHDIISRVKKISHAKQVAKITAGAAHERFTDCRDDIQGAINFCKNQGIKKIYLVGHSTGCQKAIYYLAEKSNQKNVAGVVLLCPISDYADAKNSFDKKVLATATSWALQSIKRGEPHQLVPLNLWPLYHDAQRFISLFTPSGTEEIFTYAQPNKKPLVFQRVVIPMLIVFAQADEYADRPTAEIASWFEKHHTSSAVKISVVGKANHGFRGHERILVKTIKQWL